jgi:hypothetical protein
MTKTSFAEVYNVVSVSTVLWEFSASSMRVDLPPRPKLPNAYIARQVTGAQHNEKTQNAATNRTRTDGDMSDVPLVTSESGGWRAALLQVFVLL